MDCAQSPITFNGTVTVNNNATLTIDPGVTLNMGMYMLIVYGTLIAQGNANNQIVFNGSNQTYSNTPIIFAQQSYSGTNTNPASIIQYATLNGVGVSVDPGTSAEVDSCTINYASPYGGPISVGGTASVTISNNVINVNIQSYQGSVSVISVNSGNPTITNNQFEGSFGCTNAGISVNGGSPVISGNNFAAAYCNNSYGIKVNSGSPQINSNQFQGSGYLVGVDDLSNSFFTISNNAFSSCSSGVIAENGASLTIQGNQFLKGTDGIDIFSTASVTVNNNLIDGNSRYGINGGGTISSNTISNNQIGIHNPPSCVVSGNNIVGNTVNSITTASQNVDAQNNWWGTTDAAAINQTIYDARVDPHLGTVLFVPFLTSPSTSAPAIPSYTPTITPGPAQPWTPPPTEQPIVTIVLPTATPDRYSDTFNYQVGSLINLNMITTATAVVLGLVWAIVILGYAAKRAFSKRKPEE